jgi:hypothetical protein
MKKILVVMLMLTMLLALAAAMAANTSAGKAMNGWVVDAKCGVKGANASGAACTKRCLGAGEKMAFVPDGTKDVLLVDNPDKLKGHEAEHVAVTGKVEGKSIHVESVAALAEKP